MAREYPTYIYTNETEAKSKGEFIVRTVKPRYIAKVVQTIPKPSLLILEWIDDPNETKGFYLDDYKKHALAWYTARHMPIQRLGEEYFKKANRDPDHFNKM